MEYLEIEGGFPLHGQVMIQGSKNAVLPMLSAAVLHRGKTTLHHCPRIRDVEVMLEILSGIGCRWGWDRETLWIDAVNIKSGVLPEKLASSMRASVTLMGSLLSRIGQIKMPAPGGCVIGARPIDLHVKGLEKLGAVFSCEDNCLKAECTQMKGAFVKLDFPSVGATENLILASVLAKGETCIQGAAREPEIYELCGLLNAMGACILWEGSSCIRICGVQNLHDAEYTVAADRIVAGTYLCAAAACGGKIFLKKAPVQHMCSVFGVLEKMGMEFVRGDDGVYAYAPHPCKGGIHLKTLPYPGFPTDLQSPLLAAMCLARGKSSITETVFEDRFKIVEELNGMGAWIQVEKNCAKIEGVSALHGKVMHSKELRGGAALCIAAAAAQGKSKIYGCQYIFRGYENVIRDFKNLGIVVHLKKQE